MATELSKKDCSIIKPSTINQGNKVLFTNKADAATHTDEQISFSLEKDTALPVTWKVSPSNDPDTPYTDDLTITAVKFSSSRQASTSCGPASKTREAAITPMNSHISHSRDCLDHAQLCPHRKHLHRGR